MGIFICNTNMPDAFKDHVTEAPEKIQFATGGGLEGESSFIIGGNPSK